jgi:predicted dehydrogenase
MKPDVVIVGGGMITHDQILPSLLHMQRRGDVGGISVCGLTGRTLRSLVESPVIVRAFPGQQVGCFPALSGDLDTPQPDLFRSVISAMPRHNLVVVAMPDQLHFDAVMTALRNDQHVLCVKPLVLKASEAEEIEREAFSRGLAVCVEYHKRFDDRSLRARRLYRDGMLGEFRLGTACLMEKWYYRHSNFQNWCTVENSDAFTYIGCHYVDLVHFITGLLPAAVSVHGIRDKYPNGKEGFLWCDARVVWSNGACLNVQNTLSYPDEGPGPNTQGLTMYCSASGQGAFLMHSDQYRGLAYCTTRRPDSPGATFYSEPSPDYFQYNDLGGPGLVPAGYGYRSIEFIVNSCMEVESAGDLAARQRKLTELDERGIVATPANSRFNELVVEAGRLSILNGGREAAIEYRPAPRVCLR